MGAIEPTAGLWAIREKRKRDSQKLRNFIGPGGDAKFPWGSLHAVLCPM